ncbi:hypothetical protein OIE75_01285 [Streptomyces sp. NBC_01723]|uniref:hypothetical protein n=1 Tax=unclassified Streptomyces TaxID=2593676 RepID=UPI002783F616|nr:MULTISPECIES: hypothetical protein [unclassified Streptomyces]MDQ0401602.1 hypothetical protein [Streptomyces sp. DSM 40167]
MVAAPGGPVAAVIPTVLGMGGVLNVRVEVDRTGPGVVVAPTIPAAVTPGIPAMIVPIVPVAPATTARWDRSGSCARRTCWWSTSTW